MADLDQTVPFAREAAAGYDRRRLHGARIFLGGGGALASNLALNLALSESGEIVVVDMDTIDPTNITRSPLFAGLASVAKPKAKAVAEGFLRYAYAPEAKARYAVDRVEALGLGAFQGADVIVSCVDSFATRAYLSQVSRLLGIPLVEAGFRYPRGHVSVFSNRDPAGPCWACHKGAELTAAGSCTLYSRTVVAAGGVPATQSLAAVFGALVAEAAVKALHAEFPLDNTMFDLNISTGQSSLIGLVADTDCVTGHRVAGDIVSLDVGADEAVAKIFDALGGRVGEPVLHLPHPFLVEAPCLACGRNVSVRKPRYMLTQAPSCQGCIAGSMPPAEVTPGSFTTITTVRPNERVAATRARKLGLPPGAVFEVEDERTGESFFAHLSGGVDDLFVLKTRGGS
jgi:molybdopterin-synthase adenylyltransferase